MDVLILVIAAAALVALLWGITCAAEAFMNAPQRRAADELLQESIESLRRMIERDSGREIAELFRYGGYWHAVTAQGTVPVSELLKSGYVRVGQSWPTRGTYGRA